MKNWIGLCSFLLLLIMGTLVFVTAQNMHQSQSDLRRLRAETTHERDNLRVLQAEWTYLNNPDRLEKLATTQFGLVPLDGKQYVAVNNIPSMKQMDDMAVAQAEQAPAAKPTINQASVDKALALAAAQATAPSGLTMPTAIPAALTSVDGGAE